MSRKEMLTQVTPEIPLLSLEALRPTFEKARQSVETLVLLARQRQPQSERGDWGEWNYKAVSGDGALYVPFGKDGIAIVSLHEWNHDIPRSRFTGALASWIGRPNPSREFRFALQSHSVTIRNFYSLEEDVLDRGYVFYMETVKGILQVEQFGSNAGGWYEPQITPPNNATIQIGNMKAAAFLDPSFYARLQLKRELRRPELD